MGRIFDIDTWTPSYTLHLGHGMLNSDVETERYPAEVVIDKDITEIKDIPHIISISLKHKDKVRDGMERVYNAWLDSEESTGGLVTRFSTEKGKHQYVFDEHYNIESIKVDPENSVFDSREDCNCVIETATNTLLLACEGTKVIPDTVEHIADFAFFKIQSLREIEIPASVKTIGDAAFFGCKKLRKITFNEGLVSIGKLAFAYGEIHGHDSRDTIDKRKEIEIPSTVEFIGTDAFGKCFYEKRYENENIRYFVDYSHKIRFSENNKRFIKSKESDAIVELATGKLVHVGEGMFGSLRENIKEYAEGVFINSEFDTLNLKGIQRVGAMAFTGCTINHLVVPECTEYIAPDAFRDIEGLETIQVDPENKFYDSRMCCNCLIETASGKLILAGRLGYIPDGIKIIGSFAFYCSEAEEIIIPEGVEVIENDAFAHCHNLKKVTFPKSLKRIEANAFRWCTSLREIAIPESMQYVGPAAFLGCYKVRKFDIPDRDDCEIDKGAFLCTGYSEKI